MFSRGTPTRWTLIGSGGLTLAWLSIEDHRIWPVALLGLWWSALLTRAALPSDQRNAAVGVAALTGAAIGLGASLLTGLLMLFKNGYHAHFFPDFPPGLIGAILLRAPAWGIAGALIGFGIALLAALPAADKGQRDHAHPIE